MDPKKRSRVGGRVEIVREAVSRRKMRLSDVMSESFSKYLMELDGDFIAPTGARISRIEETPTDDQIKARAGQVWKRKGSPQNQPYAAMQADYFDAKSELEAEEERVDAPPATPSVDPTDNVDNDNTSDNDGTGSNTVDVDNGVGSSPSGGDVSTVENPSFPEGGEGGVPTNYVTPEDADAQNTDPIDDAQGGAVPSDDPSKELGGPDEFDERNRAFTSYIDGLINGTPPATGGGDSLAEVSDSSLLRSRSLIEAVYGSRKLEIVNYKRSR